MPSAAPRAAATVPAPAPPPPPTTRAAPLPTAAPPSAEDPTPAVVPEVADERPPHPDPELDPEPPFARPPLGSAASPEAYDEERSRFDHEPPFRPRRNPARMWTIAAVVFAAVALGSVGAVAWYGLPDWMPMSRPTFAEAQTGLVLDFPPNRQDRRALPNGTEFYGASGTVTNVGNTRRSVPDILIVLRDARDRIVYSWEVAPPKRQLNPGESVTINEARTDIPRSAKFAEIGLKPS